jgi:hypothetical protein
MIRKQSSCVAASMFLFISSDSDLFAQDQVRSPSLFAVGLTAGTLGVGLEASYRLHKNLVLRASASTLDLNSNEFLAEIGANGDDQYHFTTTGTFIGMMIDYHPSTTGWRLTAGLRYVDLKFEDSSIDDGTIGSNQYLASVVGRVHTTVENNNPTAPYVGFGYDISHIDREGTTFSLGIDIGALYAGDPSVDITADNLGAILPTDLQQQKDKIKNDLENYYRFVPVLMIAGKIKF